MPVWLQNSKFVLLLEAAQFDCIEIGSTVIGKKYGDWIETTMRSANETGNMKESLSLDRHMVNLHRRNKLQTRSMANGPTSTDE